MVYGYAIKSESDDGIYYLVNGWRKHNAYWWSKLNPTKVMFKQKGTALRSLRQLLNTMPEYREDVFTLVEITESGGREVAGIEPVTSSFYMKGEINE